MYTECQSVKLEGRGDHLGHPGADGKVILQEV
jgi:hypothetical protein